MTYHKKDHEFLSSQTLGYAPCLGSKSTYMSTNPNKDPIFNAVIMVQDANGELYKVWYGDLELTDGYFLDKLRFLSNQLESNLYLYKSSTVNNEVFNGRMFPYQSFEATVCKDTGRIARKNI